MNVLDDTELMIARGRYSTSNSNRKSLLVEMQKTCNHLMQLSSRILSIANDRSPPDGDLDSQIAAIRDCAVMASSIGDKLLMENITLAQLLPIAWPKQ